MCGIVYNISGMLIRDEERPMATISLARNALEINVLFRRAQKRLSQAELAREAGVSRTVLSGIENGDHNPTLDILEKLATALETTVVQLLTPLEVSEDTDEEIERRSKDGPEAYVDAREFMATLDERAGRPTQRGRSRTLSR
jgi:transcriptional regulator with XRE-family HTH domain